MSQLGSNEDYQLNERDLKFKLWLQNKALRDKALEYLSKLDPNRAEDEESLLEVAISLLAVDRLLGEDQEAQNVKIDDKSTSNIPKKTMKNAWNKWTIDHHTFNNVVLSSDDYAAFSDAVKEYLYEDKEEKCFKLLSLKYHTPAVPKKPGDKTKPLTNDQKHQNAMFMRECRKVWRSAKQELSNRVTEYISKAMSQKKIQNNSGNIERKLELVCLNELSLKRLRLWIEDDEDKKITEQNRQVQEKMKEAKAQHEGWLKEKDRLRIRMPDDWIPSESQSMGFGREIDGVRPTTHTGPQTTVELMAGSGLKYVHALRKGNDLQKSRQKLIKIGFVAKENFDAEDMDQYDRESSENKLQMEKKINDEKKKEISVKAYQDWVILKEMREQALKCLALIPKPIPPTNPIIAHFGIKYHDNRGTTQNALSQSMTSNQSNTMRQSMGILSNSNQQIRECIEVGKSMKRIDRTLFPEWYKWCDKVFTSNAANWLWDFFPPMSCDVHSQLYSQTRDSFLKLLRPGVDYQEHFESFAEGIVKRKANRMGNYDNMEEDEKRRKLDELSITKNQMAQLLRQLGIVMKDIELRALIDAFDVNGDGMITISEFLNFIGPKRDRKSGATAALNQKCCWNTTCKITGMSNGYAISAPTKRFLRKEEINQKQEESSKKKQSSSSRESKHRDDEDGDDDYGRDSGHEDDENNENESQMKEDYDENRNNFKNKSLSGKKIIRILKNGEKRVCFELMERVKREELLRKLDLLEVKPKAGDDDVEMKRRKSKDKTRGEYDDEFEDDEGGRPRDDYEMDFESEKERKGPAVTTSREGSMNGPVQGTTGVCDYAIWTTNNRRYGLQYLLVTTKDARQEKTLQSLLDNGVPPKAPTLWTVYETKLETKSKNRYVNSRTIRGKDVDDEDLGDEDEEEDEETKIRKSTQLELHWEPVKGDLVSFFSLEFGGSIGHNKVNQTKYVEIFRDPENAMGSLYENDEPDEDELLKTTFKYTYTLKDLQPGTSYNFRIRAFNGFGPGQFSYKTFTTCTLAPPPPKVMKLYPDHLTLRWTFSEGFYRRMDQLKRVFQIADKDQSGSVDRDELAAALEVHAEASSQLKTFLDNVAASIGLDVKQGYGALFDMIENDDDGGLSLEEFETFFMKAGWGDTNTVKSGTASRSRGASIHLTTNAGMGATQNATVVKPSDITYVVERCTSEFDDNYTEVLRTTSGYGNLTHLEPGQSYRFRVYSINAAGVPSQKSQSVLVHTLLEQPPMPNAQPKNIKARQITLTWKHRKQPSTREKAFVDKMLGDWAGTLGEEDGGVSIEAAFAKYDRDGSGDIDASELEAMLKDLGIEVSDERLSEAFALLDKNKDGIISFEEFGEWWRRDQVTYLIKRSEEISPVMPTMTGTNTDGKFNISHNNTLQLKPQSSAGNFFIKDTNNLDETNQLKRPSSAMGSRGRKDTPTVKPNTDNRSVHSRPVSAERSKLGGNSIMASTVASKSKVVGSFMGRQVALPIVSYRGNQPKCTVAGLTPNRLYHFKLRFIGSRSNSILSPSLVVMTAPLPPSSPVVIDLNVTGIRVKWYAPQYGCYKFIVQLKLLGEDNVVNSRKLATGVIGEDLENGWTNVYNGQDTVFSSAVLAVATSYQMRILAVNYQGNCSEPSAELHFTTLERSSINDSKDALNPKNASTTFVIECTGDICIGDIIFITERIYARNPSEKLSKNKGQISSNIDLASVGGRTLSSNMTKSVRLAVENNSRALNQSAVSNASLVSAKRLNMSVTSLNGDGISITPYPGTFIGERTMAALVTKDNYRSIRDGYKLSNITPKDVKKFGKNRLLWLQVVWQRSSNEACKPFELKAGDILQREQAHLEQFEVYRCKWKQEPLRKTLHDEWILLNDCYYAMDC